MHDDDRVANLLGALGLAVGDVAVREVAAAAGVTVSAAAALVSLAATDGLSVTELGHRVGLSQPAASRLVDGLERDGLVARRPNPYGGRWSIIQPTEQGREAALRLLTARAGPLRDALSALSDDERRTLSDLLPKLLARLYGHVGNAEYVCRMCDRESCLTGPSTCPVGAAERIRRAGPGA